MGICAAKAPGLIPWASRWHGVNHVIGHLAVDKWPRASSRAFHQTGGLRRASNILEVRNIATVVELGGTLDDAAGEAFDKDRASPRPAPTRAAPRGRLSQQGDRGRSVSRAAWPW